MAHFEWQFLVTKFMAMAVLTNTADKVLVHIRVSKWQYSSLLGVEHSTIGASVSRGDRNWDVQ